MQHKHSRGPLRGRVRGLGDALRNIVMVINVYCQTGTPLSSSGGRIQILLWDSQSYLEKVKHGKGCPCSRYGDYRTHRLAFLIVTTLGTQRCCGLAYVRYKVAKKLWGSAVVADDRGDEFLPVWAGRDVIRGIYRAWLSKRDTRKSSSQPDKKIIEQTGMIARRSRGIRHTSR